MIDRPGIYDIPAEEYLADPVKGGSFSASGVKTILRAPKLYLHEKSNPRTSDAFDLGTATHTKVLGVGLPTEIVMKTGKDKTLTPAEDYATVSARQHRDEIRAAGKVPMLAKDAERVDAMAEAVLAHPIARAVLEQPGKTEQTAVAQDPESGVWLRSLIDFLPDRTEGRTVLADLKTAASAWRPDFERSAASYGYDVQAVFYQHVVRLARGDQDTAFLFLVVEKEPPHLVSVIELVGEFAETGAIRMRAGIERFKACTETGEWPGYPLDVQYAEPPRYHVTQTEEQYAL